eukprot:2387859-Pleurochrysis_carterae.AAC.1
METAALREVSRSLAAAGYIACSVAARSIHITCLRRHNVRARVAVSSEGQSATLKSASGPFTVLEDARGKPACLGTAACMELGRVECFSSNVVLSQCKPSTHPHKPCKVAPT